LSTGSAADDAEKKLRGFQHIIQELSAENADIKEKYQSVLEEVGLLKEVKLFLYWRMKLINTGGQTAGGDKRDARWRRAVEWDFLGTSVQFAGSCLC